MSSSSRKGGLVAEEEAAAAGAGNAEVAARRSARTLLDALSRARDDAGGGCSAESTMELDRPGDARKKRRAAMAVDSPPASGSGSASSRYSASSSSRKAGDDVDAEDVGGEADVDGADVDPSSYDSDGRRGTWKHPSIARSAPLGIPLVGAAREREEGRRAREPGGDGKWEETGDRACI